MIEVLDSNLELIQSFVLSWLETASTDSMLQLALTPVLHPYADPRHRAAPAPRRSGQWSEQRPARSDEGPVSGTTDEGLPLGLPDSQTSGTHQVPISQTAMGRNRQLLTPKSPKTDAQQPPSNLPPNSRTCHGMKPSDPFPL